MMEHAHALGVMVLAWTVDHQVVADHLLALGVDGLTGNNMVLLRALRPSQRSTRAATTGQL